MSHLFEKWSLFENVYCILYYNFTTLNIDFLKQFLYLE